MIVITGGSGFIGSNLLSILNNNENKEIGRLRSAGFSPKFEKIVGIAMINKDFWKVSQKFKINIDGNSTHGEICDLPIL